MRKALIVLLLAASSGCQTKPDWHWEKPNSNELMFHMDRGQCDAQAQSTMMGALNAATLRIFMNCMEGRGWYRVQNR